MVFSGGGFHGTPLCTNGSAGYLMQLRVNGYVQGINKQGPFSFQHSVSAAIFIFSNNVCQGRSQPSSPGWARVPLSSFSLKFGSIFLFFLKHNLFSSSFWPSGWVNRPLRKALATPLMCALLRSRTTPRT